MNLEFQTPSWFVNIMNYLDTRQEPIKFEIQSLALLVLHCNPSLLRSIGKISYQCSLYCGPFVWFSNCLLFEFVTDLTLYTFFSYSMFLWSTNGYLLLKSYVARIGDNGSWAVATSCSIINSSTTDIDTKVFWSLNLSWL